MSVDLACLVGCSEETDFLFQVSAHFSNRGRKAHTLFKNGVRFNKIPIKCSCYILEAHGHCDIGHMAIVVFIKLGGRLSGFLS